MGRSPLHRSASSITLSFDHSTDTPFEVMYERLRPTWPTMSSGQMSSTFPMDAHAVLTHEILSPLVIRHHP